MRTPSGFDRWGWRHVSVIGEYERNSGTKRWKCNYCNLRCSGSYNRVRAHLLGLRGEGVKGCPLIDKSMMDEFRKLDEEHPVKKKKKKIKIPLDEKIRMLMKNKQMNFSSPANRIAEETANCFAIGSPSCLAKESANYFAKGSAMHFLSPANRIAEETANCFAKGSASCTPKETVNYFDKGSASCTAKETAGCIAREAVNCIAKETINCIAKETVDETIARFFFSDGLDMSILNSSYFKEMIKAVATFGSGYEPPSKDILCDSFLSKEKAKLEKAINQIRESWPHTGCTMICVNREDGSLGCFCIDLFISSPRGVLFLKSVNINEQDAADNLLTDVLSNAITEVEPTNVLQIITHLGQASIPLESIMSSKFPHIFWSHCTSHSIHLLIEEIVELDWMKAVVLCAKGIERVVLSYQQQSSSRIKYNLNEIANSLFMRFAPSYCLVQKTLSMKLQLQDLVMTAGWKQWKLTAPDNVVSIEIAVLGDEFWARAELMLQLCEPFVTLLGTLNVDKSAMGDAYNWLVQSLEAVRSNGIDDIALSEIELLIDRRWDELFSPLQAAGYMLNPRYFGRGQCRDKIVMKGWKSTLERYEYESSTRRLLREQLTAYWRLEGSFGEEDAVECRDKMDPVSWWENFGFETPELQNLAIKVLSQVSSVSLCQEIDLRSSLPCQDTVRRMGAERIEELVFVRNNLSLLNRKLV